MKDAANQQTIIMNTNASTISRRVHQSASTQPNINSFAFALMPVIDKVIEMLPDPRKTQRRVNGLKAAQQKRHRQALNLIEA